MRRLPLFLPLLTLALAAGAAPMPPTGKLPDAEIALLTRWVADGATWGTGAQGSKGAGERGRTRTPNTFTPRTEGKHPTPNTQRHWAFLPLKRPTPPPVRN